MRCQAFSAALLSGLLVYVEGFLPTRGVMLPLFECVNSDSTNSFVAFTGRRSQSTTLYYRDSPHDMNVDFYNILGIPRTANDAEIKRAYRTKAKRFHPGTYEGLYAEPTEKKCPHKIVQCRCQP